MGHPQTTLTYALKENYGAGMSELVKAGAVDLWAERRGEGPDVLLICGLGDPAEAWEPQLEGLADRYRLTAFDNRGGLNATLRRAAVAGHHG